MKKRLVIIIGGILILLMLRHYAKTGIWGIIVSPADAVKGYYKALNAYDMKKAYKYYDFVGAYVLTNIDEEKFYASEDSYDYEDFYNTENFWEDYQAFLKTDEGKAMKKQYEKAYSKEEIDLMDALLKETKTHVKIKETKEKKVSPHLYKVEATMIETMEDEDGNKESREKKKSYYVMEKGGKYYILDRAID